MKSRTFNLENAPSLEPGYASSGLKLSNSGNRSKTAGEWGAINLGRYCESLRRSTYTDGYQNTATAQYSKAERWGSFAGAVNSLASGRGVAAVADGATVFGGSDTGGSISKVAGNLFIKTEEGQIPNFGDTNNIYLIDDNDQNFSGTRSGTITLTKREVKEKWMALDSWSKVQIGMGTDSLTFGKSNLNLGDGSLVGGTHNLNEASESIIGGYSNEIEGGGHIIGGLYNKIINQDEDSSFTGNLVGGIKNTITKSNSIVSGSNNLVRAIDSIVGGSYNKILSTPYGILISGRNNTVGDHETIKSNGSLISGQDNEVISNFSIIAGTYNKVKNGSHNSVNGFDNIIYGSYFNLNGFSNIIGSEDSTKSLGAISGNYNIILHDNVNVFGQHLTTTTYFQTLFGQYNDTSSKAIFAIGGGNKTGEVVTGRNIFEVFDGLTKVNGKLILGLKPTDDMDAVSKQYVDEVVGLLKTENNMATSDINSKIEGEANLRESGDNDNKSYTDGQISNLEAYINGPFLSSVQSEIESEARERQLADSVLSNTISSEVSKLNSTIGEILEFRGVDKSKTLTLRSNFSNLSLSVESEIIELSNSGSDYIYGVSGLYTSDIEQNLYYGNLQVGKIILTLQGDTLEVERPEIRILASPQEDSLQKAVQAFRDQGYTVNYKNNKYYLIYTLSTSELYYSPSIQQIREIRNIDLTKLFTNEYGYYLRGKEFATKKVMTGDVEYSSDLSNSQVTVIVTVTNQHLIEPSSLKNYFT